MERRLAGKGTAIATAIATETTAAIVSLPPQQEVDFYKRVFV
ncbi:hypothetical protein [Scytonema hofmannii]|nr:hypothetical protein [Scytonema hofmannii]